MVGRLDSFLLGPGLFSGAFAVSFRACKTIFRTVTHFADPGGLYDEEVLLGAPKDYGVSEL